ncbi:MAG: hypothetical protein U1E89_11115 [Burkholderiaceae bacterium]
MTERVKTLAVLVIGALMTVRALATGDAGAELMLQADERRANTRGPLAAAEALSPGLASATTSGLRLSAELRQTLRVGAGVSLHGNLLLAHERLEGQRGRDASRVNELHGTLDRGAWQWSAGKKVLGWDVGYAFRPNDVVQQEERRTLLTQTPEGRPLLQVEHFVGDAAWSVVWTQPQQWNAAPDDSRGVRESAAALRVYQRDGALDLYGFGRQGRRTGSSVGAAFAWVATDELELHGSWRAMQQHEGRQFDAPPALVTTSNPWHQATLGGASQWLLGAQWTTAQHVSLLAEVWHDGTTLADTQWQSWTDRNAALARAAGRGAPALPVAANLAWQASALQASSLRRRNAFVRVAWQDAPWQLSLDALVMPADRGRVVTAALQWQGDRVRLNAAWRRYGGPGSALAAQLPLRDAALLAASIAF